MGFLNLLLKPFIYAAVPVVVVIGILAFAPGLHPNIDYSPFIITPVSPQLQLKLDEGKEKGILGLARVLVDSEILLGPDAPVVRNGFLYVGDKRGLIHRIHPKTGEVSIAARLPCNMQGTCSWAVGSAIDSDGKFVTADVYGGLLRVDLDSESLHVRGDFEVLVETGTVVNGKPIMFPDAVTIGSDCTIYWTDATEYTVGDAASEFYGSTPTGRVLEYNPKTKETKEILSRLHFANGIQISRDEDFFVVVDTIRNRLLRYYLNGEKKGTSDVFIDGLPGSPDNVRPNGRGGFYVSILSKRQEVDIGECPKVRRFQARLFYLIRLIINFFHDLFPNQVNSAGDLDLVNAMLSLDFICNEDGAVILDVDRSGNVIQTLQSSTDGICFVSQITVDPTMDEAYFSSPFVNKIWAIKTHLLNPTS